MTAIALVFASLASLLHVYIWWMESITWRKPATWRTFGVASQADADTTAPLAYNQGFYNLFLAVGTAVGVLLIIVSDTCDAVAWTLIIFCCGSMIAAAIVLLTSGKGRLRAALIQSTFALIAVAASVVVVSS